MRYVMRQQLYTWGDKYIIQNEQELDVYEVQGKVFTLGHQLTFADTLGHELASIRQKLLSWPATYEIFHGEDLYATVHKEFTLLTPKLTIEVPGEGLLVVQGEFLQHEYTFLRQQQPVAQVSEEWFSFADTYGVEVNDGIDPVLILASTVIIDEIMHDSRR
jgi:uncharacterized protein YxjI